MIGYYYTIVLNSHIHGGECMRAKILGKKLIFLIIIIIAVIILIFSFKDQLIYLYYTSKYESIDEYKISNILKLTDNTKQEILYIGDIKCPACLSNITKINKIVNEKNKSNNIYYLNTSKVNLSDETKQLLTSKNITKIPTILIKEIDIEIITPQQIMY